MIEFDLRTYLLTDSSLKTLLGYTASINKIYPYQATAGVSTPYIIYDWEVADSFDEILERDRVELTIVGTDMDNLKDIRERLRVLLDGRDAIQNTAFYTGSADYFIYWSRFVDGECVVVPETEEFNMRCIFEVLYKQK